MISLQITKHYCDCCGAEVKSKLNLHIIETYSSFKWAQGEEYPYEYKELCKECKDQVDEAVNKIIKELEGNKNNK